ncbi:hypothetical protein IGI37_001254 [Enterococcus sp. AZ194]|uniref:ASCH domain-containing protein n=1 Tax=Enterococcus sp. AZ194 TaxID=2774629 RepID=UPI003F1E5061
MADELAELVIQGTKTVTTSAFPLYEIKEELPAVDEYSVILAGSDNPKAIIRTNKVELRPFNQISETYAFLEGEGDKSLAYWKKSTNLFSLKN